MRNSLEVFFGMLKTMKERFKLIPAVYLLLRRDDEVLLSLRANTGYQDGTYSLVAGHLDGDELATEAMIREAREEAGITVNSENLRFVHVVHRLSRNESDQERVDLFFECWDWEGDIENKEPTKCAELTWHQVDNLPAHTLPLIKLVVDDIRNGVSYSEYTNEPE